jgi:tRNA(fMet)-specific endonuclease VapC
MLYILDTDHISLLQQHNAPVITHIQRIPLRLRAVTVISMAEQVQGRLAVLSRAKTEVDAGRAFQRLYETNEFYRTVQVLPYDETAAQAFESLRRRKVRIGTQDLRIAAIALIRNSTVVTRNLRDFRQVPDLRVEDWSSLSL